MQWITDSKWWNNFTYCVRIKFPKFFSERKIFLDLGLFSKVHGDNDSEAMGDPRDVSNFLDGRPTILMHNAVNFLDIFEGCGRGGSPWPLIILQWCFAPHEAPSSSVLILGESTKALFPVTYTK